MAQVQYAHASVLPLCSVFARRADPSESYRVEEAMANGRDCVYGCLPSFPHAGLLSRAQQEVREETDSARTSTCARVPPYL